MAHLGGIVIIYQLLANTGTKWLSVLYYKYAMPNPAMPAGFFWPGSSCTLYIGPRLTACFNRAMP